MLVGLPSRHRECASGADCRTGPSGVELLRGALNMGTERGVRDHLVAVSEEATTRAGPQRNCLLNSMDLTPFHRSTDPSLRVCCQAHLDHDVQWSTTVCQSNLIGLLPVQVSQYWGSSECGRWQRSRCPTSTSVGTSAAQPSSIA